MREAEKLEFIDMGKARVIRTTQKAAQVEFSEHPELRKQWVPLSVMATNTRGAAKPGAEISRFRVEKWFEKRMEKPLVPHSRNCQ